MSETRTCVTCRWWREHDNDEEWRVADLMVKDAEHEPVVPQPFPIRVCRSPKVRFYERPEQDGAAVMDGSDYWGRLVTGPDFGCTLHTPTPTDPTP